MANDADVIAGQNLPRAPIFILCDAMELKRKRQQLSPDHPGARHQWLQWGAPKAVTNRNNAIEVGANAKIGINGARPIVKAHVMIEYFSRPYVSDLPSAHCKMPKN